MVMIISAESISAYVAEECKKHESVIAVVLNGSCARGEETYFINEDGYNEMISDFEMLVIVKSHTETESVSAGLENLRNRLIEIRHSKNFDLEWSYKTPKDLRWLDKRFFFFETKEASKVIYGDESVLRLFPEINLGNLNYSELNTVIIHRLYHVLRDMQLDDEKYKKYIIARNSLDFPTAFLPLTGILVASYAGRMAEFEKVASRYQIPTDLMKRQQDYLIMKRNFSSNLYDTYSYEKMLCDFYNDFQFLKSLQMKLQDGVLFKANRRMMMSAIYRANIHCFKKSLQWRRILSLLCDEMFDVIKAGIVDDEKLKTIKITMTELFGYC